MEIVWRILFLLGLTTAIIYLLSCPRIFDRGMDKTPADIAESNDGSHQECHAVSPKRNTSISLMTTSWYGARFHGKKTASGKRFNMHAFTAAHRLLPFGSRVRLRNPENEKEVVVTITDRGPYVGGRDLDVSRKTAYVLGMIRDGVVELRAEILELPS